MAATHRDRRGRVHGGVLHSSFSSDLLGTVVTPIAFDSQASSGRIFGEGFLRNRKMGSCFLTELAEIVLKHCTISSSHEGAKLMV